MDIGGFSQEVARPGHRTKNASSSGAEVTSAWGLSVGMVRVRNLCSVLVGICLAEERVVG